MDYCHQCGTQLNEGASFCALCGAQVQKSNAIATFTPPPEAAPIFIPPTPPTRSFGGSVCYHHTDEPASAQCGRCGKYICRDCAEVYGVETGEYANQCLCYDCCQALVRENVSILRENKAKIITTFVLTILGMILGIVIGVILEAGALFTLLTTLWCGSLWVVLRSAFGWSSESGFSFLGLIWGLIIGPFKTIIKIIQCIVYMTRTSRYIREDSAALVEMKDYMEYTTVVSRNRGVDLDTLLAQSSELYNNSYANTVRVQGEDAADAKLRQCTTRIAENGEIIRNFAA